MVAALADSSPAKVRATTGKRLYKNQPCGSSKESQSMLRPAIVPTAVGLGFTIGLTLMGVNADVQAQVSAKLPKSAVMKVMLYSCAMTPPPRKCKKYYRSVCGQWKVVVQGG